MATVKQCTSSYLCRAIKCFIIFMQFVFAVSDLPSAHTRRLMLAIIMLLDL